MPEWEMSAEQAAGMADWWARYAHDRIGCDGRIYDPQFSARLSMAIAQLAPAVTLGALEGESA